MPETITPSTTEIFSHFCLLQGLAGKGLLLACGSPGDLVSCLVAVGKLPDDTLSKQALLIEFKRAGE